MSLRNHIIVIHVIYSWAKNVDAARSRLSVVHEKSGTCDYVNILAYHTPNLNFNYKFFLLYSG